MEQFTEPVEGQNDGQETAVTPQPTSPDNIIVITVRLQLNPPSPHSRPVASAPNGTTTTNHDNGLTSSVIASGESAPRAASSAGSSRTSWDARPSCAATSPAATNGRSSRRSHSLTARPII